MVFCKVPVPPQAVGKMSTSNKTLPVQVPFTYIPGTVSGARLSQSEN